MYGQDFEYGSVNMRRNRKRDDLPNVHANNQRLESELILLAKQATQSRSARHRRPGTALLSQEGAELVHPPDVGMQLITQLADLELSTQVKMSDYVQVSVELPLWQVIELSMPGLFNHNLVDLLNASLDNRAGDHVYLARLNALILEAAQNG